MKTICIITGSRADYGLLRWLMLGINAASGYRLQIVVTGMHLSAEFGYTWKQITEDGFEIDWKVDMLLGSDTNVAVTKSMGIGLSGFADAFDQLAPDLIVVLGDRFEIFAAASAALIAGIPIAHLHGGEITEGAYDDSMRHAITKMAHFHFAASEPYRERIIQMGEDPSRVWNVGGFGLDSILNLPRLSQEDLEQSLGFKFGRRNLLVTFHPETATLASPEAQLTELLAALEEHDAHLIFTMPNADTGGRVLFDRIQKFVSNNPDKRCAHTSLGQERYLSCLALVDGVIGNSSSGLIEAPALSIGTINIGDRQTGRLKADSIIDTKAERDKIKTAIKYLYSSEFQNKLAQTKNPYGNGGASKATLSILSEEINKIKKIKTFFSIKSN